MDCDAVTVVGNLYKQRVVRRGDTCTFLYLDGKSLVLDASFRRRFISNEITSCNRSVASGCTNE